MTVSELARQLNLEALTPDPDGRAVTGGYTGDLLSWVMARLAPGSAWITVMGSLNAVAVAVLTDAACVILAEGAPFDEDARERALREGVPVLQSGEPAFRLAARLAALLDTDAR